MSAGRHRVLILVSSLEFGGAEKHAVTLLNRLDETRFDCYLGYLKPGAALAAEIQENRRDKLWFHPVKSKFDLRAARDLAAFIHTKQIEVVLCANAYPTLYASAARWLTTRPFAIAEIFHTTILRTRKDQAQMLLYRLVFRQCDLLIYVSGNQQAYWRERGLRGRTEAVIHNGIDLDYFSPRALQTDRSQIRKRANFSDADYLIGLCAALRPEKAAGDLLQAIRRLRDTGVPARVLLIGDGPERDRLEKLATELDVAGSVMITGFQSDVRPWISACDVMTLTSHSVETFSIAALEAMALDKPLVLTSIGGATEQVTPGINGFLFEPGDIDALTAHLRTLQHAQLRGTMAAAAGREVRQRFGLETMLAAYSDRIVHLSKRRQ